MLSYTAFKTELRRNPNYGKAVGMTPPQWWTNVGAANTANAATTNYLPVTRWHDTCISAFLYCDLAPSTLDTHRMLPL